MILTEITISRTTPKCFYRCLFTLGLSIFAAGTAHSFNYDEHRMLGDSAFSAFANGLVTQGEFKDKQHLCAFFKKELNITCDETEQKFYFLELSNPPNQITYGILNGLSGDQEDNLLRLREDLLHRYSTMNRIVAFKERKDSQFTDQARLSELSELNPNFIYLAFKNYSHFYDYGKTLDQHIASADKQSLLLLQSPATADRAFQLMEKSNAIAAYITFHATAMSFAEKAGKLAETDPETSRKYLSYALLYEAFCAHYLEDSFAAGHLVVRRSALGGIVNNKALHDFYNVLGVYVINLNGDVWKTFGDNWLLRVPDQWEDAKSYLDIVVSS
ncbi:MAG TPA: hypothetical protein PLL10_04890, partial [Elusimicrobiales bacterium]|nr:hypothetical protein [Elusimicrobiales bacterium]